jgi:hypothetical protein
VGFETPRASPTSVIEVSSKPFVMKRSLAAETALARNSSLEATVVLVVR